MEIFRWAPRSYPDREDTVQEVSLGLRGDFLRGVPPSSAADHVEDNILSVEEQVQFHMLAKALWQCCRGLGGLTGLGPDTTFPASLDNPGDQLQDVGGIDIVKIRWMLTDFQG